MVELIVTMIVIGILAIVIVPRMDVLRGFDEVGFRDQVKGALQYARKSAVAARRAVRVTILADAVVLERSNATPEGEGAPGFSPLNLPGRNTNRIDAPAGIVLTAGTLTFDPLGRSSGGTLVVPGAGSITVVAETGYVF